jgi:hypothetical protein
LINNWHISGYACQTQVNKRCVDHLTVSYRQGCVRVNSLNTFDTVVRCRNNTRTILHGMVVRFTIKKTNSYVQYFSDASLLFWNYNCPRPRILNNLSKTGWFYQVELQISLWLTRLLDTGGDLICGYIIQVLHFSGEGSLPI